MTLIQQITARRTAGRTTCALVAIKNSGPTPELVDFVVKKHGFSPLGENWIEISAADAQAIVMTLLHRDLAFGEEIMPLTVATDFAAQLFDLAPEPHSYFTNGVWEMTTESGEDPAVLREWDPISEAAFDSGVVCIGEGSAALLWVEDED